MSRPFQELLEIVSLAQSKIYRAVCVCVCARTHMLTNMPICMCIYGDTITCVYEYGESGVTYGVTPAFTWVLGFQTQVLILAQHVCY